MRHLIIDLCNKGMILAFAALVFTSPGKAVAETAPVAAYPSSQTTTATHTVQHKHVDLYRHLRGGHLAVALNNGASFDLAPCKFEDGSGQKVGCYWNASTAGNKVGKSFVVIHRHFYRL